MAFTTKVSVVAMLLAGNKAVGILQNEILRQFRNNHRGHELVYTYDRRGLYIKKSKHHKGKFPHEENLIDLQDNFTTEQLVNDALNMDFNVDNYMKNDPNYGFVDFGDNLVDDLRVDSKMIEESELDKQALTEREKAKKAAAKAAASAQPQPKP